MAVVFISSAADDRSIAESVISILHDAGAAEMYPSGGDQPLSYDAWDRQLLASAASCRAIILILTPNWLASDRCYGQFRAAWYMGKRIIPILFLPSRPDLGTVGAERLAEVVSEIQCLDLTPLLLPDNRIAPHLRGSLTTNLNPLIRSAGILKDVGLDPTVFNIDRIAKPAPFPGLGSYGDTEADAAVFFGRSREIALVLEELRRMRAEADYRPLVILGASGSGKSSLLKAGVLPRLRRETPSWLAVRAFRPGADPLFSFAQALSRTLETCQKSTAPGHIYAQLSSAWEAANKQPRIEGRTEGQGRLGPAVKATLLQALDDQFANLRRAANLPNACILLSVDQAEEIVRAEDAANALVDLLGTCLDQQSLDVRLALAIRTDSFPALQSRRLFEGLECRAFDLRSMNKHYFEEVIATPAERYGVSVDPDLVDAIIQAAPDTDALPLVAFTMQRLWERSSISGSITKADYQQFNGLHGLLEDAAERALRGINNPDDPLPKTEPAPELTRLARRAFIPALIDIDEAGHAIRRVARRDVFDNDQRELLKRFEQWRLVTAGTGVAVGQTIEVAHEALFREWSRFNKWLEPERVNLEGLRQLSSAALTWARKGRDAEYLTHRSFTRLSQIKELVADERYCDRLGPDDLAYLQSCQDAYERDRRHRRLVKGTIGALGALIVLGAVAFSNQQLLVRQVFYAIAIRSHILQPSIEAQLKPGDKFSECSAARFCPEMVVVPAGYFVMGQKDGEEDERELKQVTISKPFAVSRLEISFAQWDTCYQMGGCDLGAKIADGGMPRGNYPVINVSYYHAQAYAKWLSQMTGRSYRLLSEAEWEYAARGGSTSTYSFGELNEDVCAFGNVADLTLKARRPSSRTVACNDGFYVVAPVGSYKVNPFGLQDMHGNASEWTTDCYAKSYLNTPIDGSPATTGECTKRVVRGGGWESEPGFYRSASRAARPMDFVATSLGFRLARDISAGSR